jgi:hypothetical protein
MWCYIVLAVVTGIYSANQNSWIWRYIFQGIKMREIH